MAHPDAASTEARRELQRWANTVICGPWPWSLPNAIAQVSFVDSAEVSYPKRSQTPWPWAIKMKNGCKPGEQLQRTGSSSSVYSATLVQVSVCPTLKLTAQVVLESIKNCEIVWSSWVQGYDRSIMKMCLKAIICGIRTIKLLIAHLLLLLLSAKLCEEQSRWGTEQCINPLYQFNQRNGAIRREERIHHWEWAYRIVPALGHSAETVIFASDATAWSLSWHIRRKGKQIWSEGCQR